MGVSIPGLPEQSVEDIMKRTPDVRNKDCINILERWVMNGQGKQKELFYRNGGTPTRKIWEKKKLHMIQYIKIFSSE